MANIPNNAAEVFDLITSIQFRPFTENDWNAFNGCTSKNPKIAYTDDFTAIIDGDEIEFVSENEGFIFKLSLLCEC
jgi:hypothetical protein